jgi:large subunit ribosomal protein L14e
MVFTRFIEIGRVVMVNYGDDYGKLGVVMDVLDQNRALVDGPTTGMPRQVINFKRLAVTPVKVEVKRTMKTATLCVPMPENPM